MLKKYRGIILFLITMGLLFSTKIPLLGSKITNAATAKNIIVGDYIQMGTYGGSILWRCVDIDEVKGPLFLADRILTIKPFDAKGAHPNDLTAQRNNYGSNFWETSNIRAWLNSSAGDYNVIWPCGISPTSNNVLSGLNDYSAEKGFLSNFTQSERNLMNTVSQKSILNNNDSALALGGTSFHTYDTSILSLLQNYDNAYYNTVADKVFLLDVKQLNKVFQNGNTLGENYYKGVPTLSAVNNSEYKDSNYLTDKKNWLYALRTPSGSSDKSSSIRTLTAEGLISENDAYSSYLGIRPAFYMNNLTQLVQSGAGTVASPYLIASSDCDVTASKKPTNATIIENTISASLPYGITTLTIDLTVSPNATWKLYNDVNCISEITTKILPLSVGENTAYVKVTAQDGVTTKIYKIILTPSSECDLISVQTPTGALISYNTVTASLSYITDTLAVAVTISPYASWQLYRDELCTDSIAFNSMVINVGANTAYLKVTAQDGVTYKVYTLIINSIQSNPCDVLSAQSPSVVATQIIANRITANLAYNVSYLTVAVTTSPFATWKLYNDALCKNEIITKNVDLNVGLNEFYIKTTAQDGITTKEYVLIITRNILSSACNIISATNPTISAGYVGFDIIAATALYSTSISTVSVTTSPFSTWKLYTDSLCNNEITDKILNLNVGENISYIKVIAENGINSKIYKLIIYRADPSSSCDITSVTTPVGAAKLPDSIIAGVPSTTTKITVAVATSPYATWKTYKDMACTIEMSNNIFMLSVGENTAYIKVTAQDKITTRIYTLNVLRFSTTCDITSVIAPAMATIETNTITAGVSKDTSNIIVSIVPSAYATWGLYSDVDCTSKIIDNNLSLNIGSNTAYIKVIAQDGITSKIYTLVIYRGIVIGDYIVMGKYYDEPILWRCVDIDINGPLLLSDKILSLKSYDAKGVHPIDSNNDRLNFGSNLWETSNIRTWLNSTDGENSILWACGNAPTSSNVWGGYNAYDAEKGFLADGNFTTVERNVIKSVSQKSILNDIDKGTKAGGITDHINNTAISTVVQNFDTTAYYQNVTDKMFLLDVKQANKVWQNGSSILGASYYIGQPTKKAVENSQYKNSYLAENNNWYYWLRTPDATGSNPSGVRYVYSDGLIYSSTTLVQSLFGVRPAFYMNLKSGMFESGNGSVATPYTIALAPKTIDLKSSSLGDPLNVVFPQAGGTHDLAVTYQNNTNEVQNTVFVVAIKKDNKLISLYPIYKTFELSEEYTFSHSIDIPSTTDSSNVEVDFYLWDGFDTMKTKHDTVKNSINNVR